MKYVFRPEVDRDTGRILIEEGFDHPLDSLRNQMHMTIIDTRDQVIRKSLIELGWTPPSDDK